MRMLPARIASVPKMAAMAASRWALPSGPRTRWNSCARRGIGLSSPLASRSRRPSSLIAFAPVPIGACRRISIVLSEVPASEPLMPSLAIIEMATAVSVRPMPAWWATVADCCSDEAMSVISAVDALAEAASTSATLPACDAFMPKAFSVSDWISAALALSIPAAAASIRVPRAASIDCLAVMPPLASCTIASAASLAEVPGSFVSAPSCLAVADTCFIWALVAPETACMSFRADSKSAALLIA